MTPLLYNSTSANSSATLYQPNNHHAPACVGGIRRNPNSARNLYRTVAAPIKTSANLHMDYTNSKITSYKIASIKRKNVVASSMKDFASMAIDATSSTLHPVQLVIKLRSLICSSWK